MSKTPRTDEREFAAIDLKPSAHVVYASFARQLETELAAARAEAERLKGVVVSQITPEPFTPSSYSTSTEPTKDERDRLIEQMREALHLADDLIDEYAADYEHRDNVDEIREEIKAALAAERGE